MRTLGRLLRKHDSCCLHLRTETEKGSNLHFDKSLQTPLLLSRNCRRGTSLVCKACSGGDDSCAADLKAHAGMADMSARLRGTDLDILGAAQPGPCLSEDRWTS